MFHFIFINPFTPGTQAFWGAERMEEALEKPTERFVFIKHWCGAHLCTLLLLRTRAVGLTSER